MGDYLNSPTTYDGIKDISEVHPSIRAADLWPKMRSMKQQDLYDISAYVLYQNYTIPEKWAAASSTTERAGHCWLRWSSCRCGCRRPGSADGFDAAGFRLNCGASRACGSRTLCGSDVR